MSNLVKFAAPSWNFEEAASEDKTKMDRASTRVYIPIAPGRNWYRFLPTLHAGKSPIQVRYRHYVPNAENPDRGEYIICPHKNEGRACPVCIYIRAAAANQAVSPDRLSEIEAKFSWFANVIVRENEAQGVKVLSCSSKKLYDALMMELDPKARGFDFTDPNVGYDVCIDRTGEGRDTRYQHKVNSREPYQIEQDWWDGRHDLIRLLACTSIAEIERLTGFVLPNNGGPIQFDAHPMLPTPPAPPASRGQKPSGRGNQAPPRNAAFPAVPQAPSAPPAPPKPQRVDVTVHMHASDAPNTIDGEVMDSSDEIPF